MRGAAVLIAVVACSESSPPPATTTTTVPDPVPTSRELASMIPTIASAKVLSKKAPNASYALETWCIDEADAIARVTAALERDGWTAVRTRNDSATSEHGARISIAAIMGEVRFSGRTGGGDARCAGTYLTATVMRLGAIDSAPR